MICRYIFNMSYFYVLVKYQKMHVEIDMCLKRQEFEQFIC